MGLYTGGFGKDAQTEYVTPDERASLMAQLGQRSGQAIEALGLVLDTPGAIARGILAGDPLSGFSFDRDTRVTGEELLDSYGFKPKDSWVSTGLGFLAEVATDPLAYATLPLSAYSKAGSAAAKAGLTKYAPFLASQKIGSEATRTGKFTLNALEEAGLRPTTGVLQTRPLLGPRLSQQVVTLDEVVRNAPDPADALQKVQQALGDTPYDSVKDDRLGGLFGFTNPFTKDRWAYNPALKAGQTDDISRLTTSQSAADLLDRVGQGMAWSYPSRLASSFFSNAVSDQIGVADQIAAMRRYEGHQQALAAGRSEATLHAVQLNAMPIPDAVKATTGVDNFFSPAGADSLLRLIEGKPINNDLDLLRGVPGLDDWIVGWRQIASEKLDAAKRLGLKANELQDPFGTFFSPRSAPQLDFSDTAMNSAVHTSLYSAHINAQIARNKDLFVPGGTYQLQEISLDPRVRAWMKGQSDETEEQIGSYIASLVGNPLVTDKQGIGIAEVFRRLGKDVPDDIPVFGTHPIIEQMGYIINEELRRNNAESAFEAIAEAAVNQNSTRVAGGLHMSVGEALHKIGEALGLAKGSPEARNYLREQIVKNLYPPGTPASSVKLKNLAVPEEVVNRIRRITAFYNSPVAQKEVAGIFDKYTTLFKSAVLAWPSRFARDFYSNAFSIWLENGDAVETARGLWAGSKIVNNEWGEVLPYLKEIPRYAQMIRDTGLNDAGLIARVQRDVGETGILQGLATADLLSASRRGDVAQYIPGSTPISVSRALSQLVPDGTRTLTQQAADFATIKGVTTTYETLNPLYKASNMLGDTIDSTGRLAGFFSLMRKGVAPEEASRRMMGALVDYSSLTPFERNTMRRIFPWWAYTSRIGKYAVESLMQNPGGRYAQTLRFINDAQATTEDSYIPTSLRQRFAIRVPEGLLGEGQNRTYLTDIDLPGVDVLNLVRLGYQPDVLGSLLQTGQQTVGEVFQQTNPLYRSVAELATGQDFFSKRPLEQAVTPYDTLYRAATGDQYARINPLLRAGLSNAVAAVPLGSRGVSTAANLVDARLPNVPYRVLKTTINALTGVKLQNVDPEYEALDALTKIRGQLAPYNREFVQSYIPKELLPRIPLESQRMDALSRDLQRELREIYSTRYGR
jgi:hypothetical protein